MTAGVVVLADEPAFALGDLTVRPALRQVVCTDGGEHILEPRVMQVLVALARAQGAIVSRDRLIEQCWEGRIVGEDAINRVIGRLRQFAQADAANAFRIDTVPRVGYRLVARDQPEPFADPAALIPIEPPPLATPDRRALLIGAATAAAVVAGGGVYWQWYRPQPVPSAPVVSPEVAALLARARDGLGRGSPEGLAEATGLFKHLVDIAPQNADAWGGLALVYGIASRHPQGGSGDAERLLALAALQKVSALDPHNAFIYGAQVALMPGRGSWLQAERVLREGIRYHPDSDGLLLTLANVLASVGRMREAAEAMEQATAAATVPTPELVWFRIQSLWAANRLQEADSTSVRGIDLFPRQSSVWFSRFYFLMFTERLADAISFAQAADGRPPGIPDEEFVFLIEVAGAMRSRAQADVANAAALVMDSAHMGGGFGENALMFLCALGHVDEAFTVAQALYFNRGFTIGALRFSSVQRAYTQLSDRRTRPLFLPPTKPMRRDPRFQALVTELGLTDYWHKAGAKPDYQAGGNG